VTVLISPNAGQVSGMNHDVKTDKFNVDMTLDSATPDDFDAVMLPGCWSRQALSRDER
jgi:protease I